MGIGLYMGLEASADAAGIWLPKRPRIIVTPHDLDILTRTVWGEGRGTSTICKLAICHTVFNRVLSHSPLFAKDISVAVACKRASQFSSWRRLNIHLLRRSATEYKDCQSVAATSVNFYNRGFDDSRGATHFETHGTHAAWTARGHITARIDHLDFYRLDK